MKLSHKDKVLMKLYCLLLVSNMYSNNLFPKINPNMYAELYPIKNVFLTKNPSKFHPLNLFFIYMYIYLRLIHKTEAHSSF